MLPWGGSDKQNQVIKDETALTKVSGSGTRLRQKGWFNFCKQILEHLAQLPGWGTGPGDHGYAAPSQHAELTSACICQQEQRLARSWLRPREDQGQLLQQQIPPELVQGMPTF